MRPDPVEYAMYAIMMALGMIPDFTDWYECAEDLV
jgi:hypothetical protein